MTDKAAPKRPDSCPSCGSPVKDLRLYVPDPTCGVSKECGHDWHATVATTTPQRKVDLHGLAIKMLDELRSCICEIYVDEGFNGPIYHFSFEEKAVQVAEKFLRTAEENQDDQTESSKMPVLRGERDSVSQQSPNVVVRDIPEGEIARVKKEENQDAGIHGRNSGGDVLGISGLGNSDGSVVNRRMGTGEVPAAPSEHSVEIEENQDDGRAVQGNQKYIDGTRVPTGSDYRTPNRSDVEVAPPLTEAPQPDPLTPSLSLLVKLGSIAVHADELAGPNRHQFDVHALQTLLEDQEINQWVKAMGVFMPVKR
jgi:hypothetical protein